MMLAHAEKYHFRLSFYQNHWKPSIYTVHANDGDTRIFVVVPLKSHELWGKMEGKKRVQVIFRDNRTQLV